jgi:cyanophycin synthetase
MLAAAGPAYHLRRIRAHRRSLGLDQHTRNAFYERMWRDAAMAVGAEVDVLAEGLLELRRGGARTRVFQQTVALDDPVTLRLALDKHAVHRLLADAGVRIPEHVEFRFGDPGPALAFLERAGGPCVVKPASGTGGGHGITAGITCADELMRACVHSGTGTERMLIERQAGGDVYRLLLLEGELLDVVRSVPARVTGDGNSTVSRLIAAECERRVAADGAAGLSRLVINLDTVLAVERQGLSLRTVLPAGKTIAVRAITSDNGAANNETFTGTVAEEVLAQARTAAAAVGLMALAGVDVITPDPARPLEEVGGVINEVNGTPGLHHHYLVADPARATHVAVPILERLLRG